MYISRNIENRKGRDVGTDVGGFKNLRRLGSRIDVGGFKNLRHLGSKNLRHLRRFILLLFAFCFQTHMLAQASDPMIQDMENVTISENDIFSGGDSKNMWTLVCAPECDDSECDCECFSGCDCDVSLYFVDEIERGGIFRGSLSVENMLFCFELETFIEGERSMFSGGASRDELVYCALPYILSTDDEPIGLFKGGASNAFFISCLQRPTVIEVPLPIFQGGRSFLNAIACDMGVPLGDGTLFVGGISRGLALACIETEPDENNISWFHGDESRHMLSETACFATSPPPEGENMFGGNESRPTAIFCEDEVSLGDEPTAGGYFRGGASATLSDGAPIIAAVACFTSPCLDLDPAEITLVGVIPVCVGGTVMLHAARAATWQWQRKTSTGDWEDLEGETDREIVISSEQEGLFVYRYIGWGSDPDECENTSDGFNVTFIDEIPQPVITVDGSSMICAGGSVALHSTEAYRYEWYFNSNKITNVEDTDRIIWVAQAGDYTVTIIDENGCPAFSEPVTLTASAYPAPDVMITVNGRNELCLGVDLEEKRILTAESNAKITDWRWSTDNQWTTASPNITVSEAGKYTVRVRDNNGCETTADSIQIIVHEIRPVISYPEGLEIICWGGHIVLSLAPHAGNISWWHNNVLFEPEPEHFNDPQTELWVFEIGEWYAVLDTLGCMFKSPVVLVTANSGDRPAKIMTQRDDNLLCEGSSVMLSAADAGEGATYLWSTGEETQHIWVNLPGDYTLTVVDSYGCPDVTEPFELVLSPVLIQPQIEVVGEKQPTICPAGSGDSEIRLYVTEGETFLWSTGDDTKEIIVSYAQAAEEENFYVYVIAYDANDCSRAAEPLQVIAVPVLSPVVETGIGVICGDEPLGISVSVWGENVTYLWSNGETDSFIEVAQAGDYDYTVTTAEGCAFSSPPVSIQQVDSPAPPVITSNFAIDANDHILICLNQLMDSDVKLRFTPAEGIVSWLWNTDAETAEIAINETGEYSVTVTDTRACTAVSDPITVDLKGGLVHIVTENDNTELCPGVSILMTVVDYEDDSSFEWYKDNVLLIGETSSSYETSSVGLYHAVVFAPGGCVESTPAIEITEHPTEPIYILTGGRLDICPDVPVYLIATQGISYEWRWNDDVDPFNRNQYIYADKAGKYEVTVTDEFGCKQTESVDVTVRPEYFPIIITERDVICQDESLTFSIQGVPDGSTFLWNTGEETPTITFNDPSHTGNQSHWVYVTTPDGCTFRSPDKNFLVNPIPREFEITISASGGLCPDRTVVLTVPGGFSAYRWRWEILPGVWENYSDENGDGSSYWIVVNQNAHYEMTITNNLGCSRTEDLDLTSLSSATVEIFPSGEVSLCENGYVTLTALAENVNYRWSNGETTQSIIVSQPGAFSVEIFDPNTGCSAISRQVTVRGATGVFPATISTVPSNAPTNFCEGGTVTLTSSLSPTGIYQWLRMYEDEITEVGNWRDQEVNQSGRYMVAYYDRNNCRVLSNIITVNVHSYPEATISPSGTITVCQGELATLAAPEGTGLQYLWSTGATTRVVEVPPGRYTVSVTSQHGCSVVSPPVVIIEAHTRAPVPWAENIEISAGEQAILTAESNIENPMFLWWNAPTGGNVIAYGDTFETDELFDEFKIWLSVMSEDECESLRHEVTVTVSIEQQIETGPIYRLPNRIEN